MKSFEGKSIENADIDRLHEKALGIIEADRFQEKDFIEPYGEENIKADLERVRELESKFGAKDTAAEREMKKVADIFEALVLWNSEQSEWLGENVTTVATSKYDDYVNGIDAIVELRQDKTASYVGLATDVTFTSDTTGKFDSIREGIEKGELGKVKYFHSSHMDIHGQKSKLPKVIIGAEKSTVLELGELWAERRFKELAEHKMQIMILVQIQEQLETYARYAESIDKPELVEIYRSTLDIINGILAQKAELVLKTKYEINDMVHSSIVDFMKRWRVGIVKKDNK